MYRIVSICCERDASQADAAVPLIIVARIAYRDTMYRIVAICCERNASQADAADPLIIVARIAYRDTMYRIVALCCERNASQADAAMPLARIAYHVSNWSVALAITKSSSSPLRVGIVLVVPQCACEVDLPLTIFLG